MPDIELYNIKEKDVMYLVHELLQAEYSKSTIKSSLIVLSQAFDKAHDDGLMESNPAQKVRVPQRAPEKEVRALTKDEQKRVVEASKTCALGHIVIFLLETGLRRAELIDLKWEDYSRDGKYIVVRKSKTPSGVRMIPLTELAVNIIEMQPCIAENIFLNTKNEKLSYTAMRKLCQRIQKTSGIKSFTAHVCRHTFATRLIENGADAKSVSILLGHTDVSFTLNRYTTIDDEQLRKAVQMLD